MRPGPPAHPAHEGRVVDAPEAPLGDRVELGRVRAVQPVVGCPLGLAADVVEVVRDHVHVAVPGVVRLRAVAREIRAAVALRVPDHAQHRRRVHVVVVRHGREAEGPQACVQLDGRAAVQEQVDTREGLAEGGRRVCCALEAPALRVGAVAIPVPVHLRKRPDEDRPGPLGDRLVQRAEVVVTAPTGDGQRRDRLVRVRPAARGREGHQRHRPVARELHRQARAPARALSPAEDHVANLRVLAGLRREPSAVAEHAERDACLRRLREHEGRGEREQQSHCEHCAADLPG